MRFLKFLRKTLIKKIKNQENVPKPLKQKIKNIQKIIQGKNKSKPYLNMTTKGSSRKQIIVSMNNENKSQFIKDSSSHIANINRLLKYIKFEIVTNFTKVEKF